MAFKKYTISENELIKIARLCKQEQGSLEGSKAEASLAANLLETHSNYANKYGSDIYSFMRNSGWFYKAAYFMDNGSAPKTYVDAIKDVLVNGNRTLPLGVDEHDCLSDIRSVSNNGVQFDKKDRSQYQKGVTWIVNTLGSQYTFYCFPSSGSDPFGYTKNNEKYMGEVKEETKPVSKVIVGSARIDENGHATYGKAGDQTGKEVSTQEWYIHSKGWVTLRAKDPEKRKKIAYAMRRACDNPHIGYDQIQRYTAYDWCKYNNGGNYDPGSITVNVETDCSALVRLCMAYAGIFVGDFYTGNEVEVLMATGAFEKLTSNKYTVIPDYLMEGDIQVTKQTGHTIVILNDGPYAQTDSHLSDEKSITECIAKGQTESIKFTGHGIEVDGIRGRETMEQMARVLQVAMNYDYNAGLEEDGIFGPKSRKAIKGHYVKRGETQYMVTALEIIMYLRGKNPKGVEYPGEFGPGLEAAVGMTYVDADTFIKLIS